MAIIYVPEIESYDITMQQFAGKSLSVICYLTAGVRLGDRRVTSLCRGTSGTSVPSPAMASIQWFSFGCYIVLSMT